MPAVIPIRNIFLLFCYAWDQARFGKALIAGSEDPPSFENLLARALSEATRQLIRTGVDVGYRETEDEISGIRGRILLTASIPLIALRGQRLACRFTELSHDTPANRILKAGLVGLSSVQGLDRTLAIELRHLAQQMQNVADVALQAGMFRTLQMHRHMARYDLALSLCRLVLERSIPSEDGQGYRFTDPLSDDVRMAEIFERFVRNFWKLEAKGVVVAPGQVAIGWNAPQSTRAHARLPTMRADILVQSQGRRLIADTKYYREALVTRFEATKVRSGHLYQLLAYLRNDSATGGGAFPDGLLLYPAVATHIDDRFELEGHRVRVATVDLDQPWSVIEGRMLALLDLPVCQHPSLDRANEAA